jgi:hypothetical protein
MPGGGSAYLIALEIVLDPWYSLDRRLNAQIKSGHHEREKIKM